VKIDLLIGIIAILQQKGRVTAPYLAEKFEVSRRTVSRDIEDICKAGIPIVTQQGRRGGISLMPGFQLDTTVLTESEMAALLAGLRTIDSVSDTPGIRILARKLGADKEVLTNSMQIDLSSFYKDDLARKIGLIQTAIKAQEKIAFHYYYPKGEEDKVIEPYATVFQWSDWYVFGYCEARQDFRLYKLRRLWELQSTHEKFIPREVPEEKKRFGSHMTDDYFVTAIYDPSVKYRLVEEYGPASFEVMEDGRLLTRWGFSSREQAVLHFLSFGGAVQVIGPAEMVEHMRSTIREIAMMYDKT